MNSRLYIASILKPNYKTYKTSVTEDLVVLMRGIIVWKTMP